jgi:hypothetical protein
MVPARDAVKVGDANSIAGAIDAELKPLPPG